MVSIWPCTTSEAQGRPPSSYTPRASTAASSAHSHARWEAVSTVSRHDLRGHGESGAPPNLDFNWTGFGTDVLTVVDTLGLEGAVGVGHSCGGAALLLAEEARPGTFSALYCFEPVVFAFEVPPTPNPAEPLARRARQRREIFASREDAYANYEAKPPLDALDPEALGAYVEFGFEDLPDGTVRLLCRGENEARVYEAGFGHPAFSQLASVNCPVVLACGAESQSFGPSDLELLVERLGDGRLDVLPGLAAFRAPRAAVRRCWLGDPGY